VHWLVWLSGTVVVEQDTVTDVIVGGADRVTVAEPDLVESWLEVAVIVADPAAGTATGAVYSPELVIVPEFAVQVTAEL
jgi:hypothetical protein